MPLPDAQIRECLKAAGEFISVRRPPPEIRNSLDYRADIRGQELTIISVRPAWNEPKCKIEHPIAKAKWVGARKVWRLYWMRADMKWHSYEPLPESSSIGRLLAEVNTDPHCCFFG